jgi:hypothetical protein
MAFPSCPKQLQSAQTEPEDQNVRRHLGQCGQDSDLDSINLDVALAVSATDLPFRLELGESRGAAAYEPPHPSRFDGLARRTVHHATPSTGPPAHPVGLRLILDSTRRHERENPSSPLRNPHQTTWAPTRSRLSWTAMMSGTIVYFRQPISWLLLILMSVLRMWQDSFRAGATYHILLQVGSAYPSHLHLHLGVQYPRQSVALCIPA